MRRTKMRNNLLLNSRRKKNDEFFTLLEDIDKELKNYQECFENKIIYCNCDDFNKSNFVKYFKENFEKLKIKKLFSSSYRSKKYFVKDKNTEQVKEFPNDNLMEYEFGDFRNEYCINLMKESDIICTNPPFTLLREFLKTLFKFNKKFLIIGTFNVLATNEIFPFVIENKIWIGWNKILKFSIPDENGNFTSNLKDMGYCRWLTNLKWKPKDFFWIRGKLNPEDHQKFDNLDVLNVDHIYTMPENYFGVMGVPVSFLDHYHPEQFKILGKHSGSVNGRNRYTRILIQRIL